MNELEVLKAVENICEKMSDRTAVLFLGSGINAGIKNDLGIDFPLGDDLGKLIAKDLLGETDLFLSLEEAAEIARYKIGDQELNKYIYNFFSSFKPGPQHLILVQLPWDVIFTTNYDLLIEKTNEADSIQRAGTIKSLCSEKDDMSQYKEEDILYYKLHGSIDLANTPEGRLILTKEDYRHYIEFRKPLFKRLKKDLLNRTFVFVGYSLKDNNFRSILDECRDELGAMAFPLSYVVRPKISNVERTYWKEKYNILLLDSEANRFFEILNKSWGAQERKIIPLDVRRSKEYELADISTRFQKIGNSFYVIDPDNCVGASNPGLFYKGAEPRWGDIREKIAPNRDIYWSLMDAIFSDLTNPENIPDAFLVTGAAGTGKTSLIHNLAFDLSKEYKIPVLMHISGTPLDINLLGPLVDQKDLKRIIVIVKNAAEYLSEIQIFIDEAKRKRFPISMILEERKNQWAAAINSRRIRLIPPEFELGSLSINEIKEILGALSRFNLLGKIRGLDWDQQISHFTSLADKDLLVALRELTSEGRFDEIIKDEFDKIPSEIAKRAYIYVSALSQFDLAIRYETLFRILNISYLRLGKEIFTPTEGVLISLEEVGYSRHNLGFRIRTRHPIIASIIFSEKAQDDESKFEIINNIISNLDAGFPEDKEMLREITRKKEIVYTLISIEKRRAFYDRLKKVMPGNPYVLQHRSIFEKDMGNTDLAIMYAKEAVVLEPNNQALLNTLGLAFEKEAKAADNQIKKHSLWKEALKIFNANISRRPSDPYGYVGKVYIIRQQIEEESDQQKKEMLEAEAIALLEEGFEITSGSNIVAAELALQHKTLGDIGRAKKILEGAIKQKPEDTRLRDILIKILRKTDPKIALKIALDGIKLDPTAWRLMRHAARISGDLKEAPSKIEGFYESAIRYKKGDISLLVEYGAFLFIKTAFSEAKKMFDQAKQLDVPGYEKKKIREYWTNNQGDKITFKGTIVNFAGAGALVRAIPENFEAFFFRTMPYLMELKINDKVSFKVGFNAWGAYAEKVDKV